MKKSLLSLLNANLRLPGQTIQEFGQEIKALSDSDKKWYAEAFVAEGFAATVTMKDRDGNETIVAGEGV